MKARDLKTILGNVPDDFDVLLTDGHEYWQLQGENIGLDANQVCPEPYNLIDGTEVDGGVFLIHAGLEET